MQEASAIDALKGIGEKTKKLFEKAGIYTIHDLLHYYPRTYDIYEEITDIGCVTEGQMAAVCGAIQGTVSLQRTGKLQITSTKVKDRTGSINVRWFHMPYLKNTLKSGQVFVFRGKTIWKGQQLFLEQPAVFPVSEYERIKNKMQPVYPLVQGLTNKIITKAIKQALEEVELEQDLLSEKLREKWNLAELRFSLEQIHFPLSESQMALARERLVFEEFFLFILALRSLKENRVEQRPVFTMRKSQLIEQVIQNLPFSLTGDQKKVWEELEKELSGEKVMARLIQGDVGSGKTILAVLALLMTADHGYQGAMMVPTEVLARQQYESLLFLLKEQKINFQVELLTGSMTAKQKKEACQRIKEGKADIIVGTHALIQEKVEYKNLVLVITDEQHRFGVKQRENFSMKGKTVHTIVMSATPIPRTLAVILYGDLDISVIHELPSNRLPIKNCVVGTSYRRQSYSFIQKEVESGRQAYVICPMVEENETIEAENVMEYTEQLKNAFPSHICIEYLHGKMKSSEKNSIMDRFLKNEIQVLVSTTVVEVGVNVPNATVMMIENAERFGLAQLHQLRGRVGRGKHQSYCIMVYGIDNSKTRKRLDILNHSNDGFYIAGEDLKLRGPGDLFGIRQSGIMEFRLGDVFQDAAVLQKASDAVNVLLLEDEKLEKKEHQFLKRQLYSYTQSEDGRINL